MQGEAESRGGISVTYLPGARRQRDTDRGGIGERERCSDLLPPVRPCPPHLCHLTMLSTYVFIAPSVGAFEDLQTIA